MAPIGVKITKTQFNGGRDKNYKSGTPKFGASGGRGNPRKQGEPLKT